MTCRSVAFLSHVPYSDNWADEGALLVSGPGGLGPLMAMQLRLLDFSQSGHQSTHPFPICGLIRLGFSRYNIWCIWCTRARVRIIRPISARAIAHARGLLVDAHASGGRQHRAALLGERAAVVGMPSRDGVNPVSSPRNNATSQPYDAAV